MTLVPLARRLVAAGVLAVGLAPAASAADTPAPAAPPLPAPAPVAAMPHYQPSCPTCNGGDVAGVCSTCGKAGWGGRLLGGHKAKPIRQPFLCPNACFGYFQTQWTPWCEACPIPYAGHGASDAPPPKAPAAPPLPGGAPAGPREGENLRPAPKAAAPDAVPMNPLPRTSPAPKAGDPTIPDPGPKF